jgi:hypothetical protein
MAQLRVKQLWSGRRGATALLNVYTVPAGHRAILKSISATSLSGASQRFWISLHGNPYILEHDLGASGTSAGSAEISLWVVLEPGQTISVELANATNVDFILSGTEHFI